MELALLGMCDYSQQYLLTPLSEYFYLFKCVYLYISVNISASKYNLSSKYNLLTHFLDTLNY